VPTIEAGCAVAAATAGAMDGTLSAASAAITWIAVVAASVMAGPGNVRRVVPAGSGGPGRALCIV